MRRLSGVAMFALAAACSQPAPPAPAAPPAPRPVPAPQLQRIIITDRDLPPVDANRFLYVFPIRMDGGVERRVKADRQPLDELALRQWCLRLQLRPMTAADRKELAGRVGVKDRFKDYFRLGWEAEPARDEPTATDTKSSFVMDYEDPRFTPVWSTVSAKWGERPQPAELESFVASYINIKTTTRMFDTAAEVAKSHRGDCSEHATLLTALLRRSGKAARLVTGLVIVVDGQQLGAFGHAWAEWYDAGKWRIADAAMHPVPGQPAENLRAKRYVPVVRMIDEGPGFAAAMDKVRSIEAVSEVEVDECRPRDG